MVLGPGFKISGLFLRTILFCKSVVQRVVDLKHRIHSCQPKHPVDIFIEAGQVQPPAFAKVFHCCDNSPKPAGIDEIHLRQVQNHPPAAIFGLLTDPVLELNRHSGME